MSRPLPRTGPRTRRGPIAAARAEQLRRLALARFDGRLVLTGETYRLLSNAGIARGWASEAIDALIADGAAKLVQSDDGTRLTLVILDRAIGGR